MRDKSILPLIRYSYSIIIFLSRACNPFFQEKALFYKRKSTWVPICISCCVRAWSLREAIVRSVSFFIRSSIDEASIVSTSSDSDIFSLFLSCVFSLRFVSAFFLAAFAASAFFCCVFCSAFFAIRSFYALNDLSTTAKKEVFPPSSTLMPNVFTLPIMLPRLCFI